MNRDVFDKVKGVLFYTTTETSGVVYVIRRYHVYPLGKVCVAKHHLFDNHTVFLLTTIAKLDM